MLTTCIYTCIYSSLKEAHRPVPLDQFTKHFYRQKVLTEGAAYPELYRKPTTTTNTDDTYSYKDLYNTNTELADVVSPLHYTQISLEETKGSTSTSRIHQPATSAAVTHATSAAAAARYTHMTASDVDVKRVEDEVEDPPELLKEYYEAYVLPLSHYTATSTATDGPTGSNGDGGMHDSDVSQA